MKSGFVCHLAFISVRETRQLSQKSHLVRYYITFSLPYITLKVFQTQEPIY